MADQQQMLHSTLVLQQEAMKRLTSEFYQQVEAFVTLAGEHPLTHKPLRAAHDDAVALRTTSAAAALGSANLISDAVARLTRDTCDAQACVRNPLQMTEFLKRVAETIKTEDDRVQVLYTLDRTLQRARASRNSSSSNSSNNNNNTDPAAKDAGRAMVSHFDQSTGYTMLLDWFIEVSSYADDSRRRLTQLLLSVLLRNKPVLPGARKHVLTTLRRNVSVVSGRANKALAAQVIEKYRNVAA